MRRLLVGGLLAALLCSSPAAASPVLVLDGDHVKRMDDPWLAPAPAGASDARAVAASSGGGAAPGATTPALPRTPSTPAAPRASKGRRHRKTVIGELKRLLAAGAIDADTYAGYRATYDDSTGLSAKLVGTRRTELGAVRATLSSLAAQGRLTATRLPALFLTLARNREWWSSGPLLSYGQRVEFKGSRLVWQEYPGQGLQLQMLASFGKVNGLLQGRFLPGAQALLGELIPLAARRAGGLAWESYFAFDGGRPPWVSGMTEGTAVQALARASVALSDPTYLDVARQALGVFSASPPTGVRIGTKTGAHYLLYSFAPGARVLNGFIQSLNGLFDLWRTGGVAEAQPLYEAGLAEAEKELPRYDTGAWSLYQPGIESTLGYHELVRDFLQGLCDRSLVQEFCTEASRFTAYLTRAPRLLLLTRVARQQKLGSLKFRISKISRVGITVSWQGRLAFSTSAQFGRGTHALALMPRHSGDYAVTLFARDLAGNTKREQFTVKVRKAPKKRAHRAK